jgi:hypothetical protein
MTVKIKKFYLPRFYSDTKMHKPLQFYRSVQTETHHHAKAATTTTMTVMGLKQRKNAKATIIKRDNRPFFYKGSAL